MNPIRFWLLFAGLAAASILGFCEIAPADAPKKRACPPTAPTVKLGQPSRVLVRLGTAYRAEYRKPKASHKPRSPRKPK